MYLYVYYLSDDRSFVYQLFRVVRAGAGGEGPLPPRLPHQPLLHSKPQTHQPGQGSVIIFKSEIRI